MKRVVLALVVCSLFGTLIGCNDPKVELTPFVLQSADNPAAAIPATPTPTPEP